MRLRATRQIGVSVGETILAAWLLITGFWNDSGAWDDAATWNDGV